MSPIGFLSSSNRSTSVSDLTPSLCEFTGPDGVLYKLERVIGRGGYGLVYACTTGKGASVALKAAKGSSLVMEAEVLKKVNEKNCRHFCQFLSEGFSQKLKENYIIMDIQGPNFSELRNMIESRRFSLPSSLRATMQMLNAIEELHACGFVSRDIKPSNFVVGAGYPGCRMVRMIDFGIAKKYANANGELLKRRPQGGWRGTGRYCSLANHNKKDQCRRDDVESWFYVACEVMRGRLPWAHISRYERDALMEAKKKVRGKGRDRFFRKLPGYLSKVLPMIDSWEFVTKPEYEAIYAFIDAEMKEQKFDYRAPYDWEGCTVFTGQDTGENTSLSLEDTPSTIISKEK
ncbi:hypothetical protein L596_023777 [Steinernema carpocapsae]|uniref:Protein kinase domain-containing protein n=1 Tax=Steinernema carpocapsae TaxID=34508 RepID=A0A4U5MEN5_STECR|nr:hypothetical protein L596_023777 [Steinernema carpocapsae]